MSSVPKFVLVFIVMSAFILNSAFAQANNPPVLELIGGKQVDEGQLLEFTISASDADNDTLAFSKNDSRGTLNQNTGHYSWSPAFNESGVYFVQFTVSDGTEGASEIIMVNITETGNHAPTLNLIGGKQVLEGQLLEFLISASDPDSDALAFSTNSSFGALDSTGNFSWLTDFDDAGVYFVLFSVSDMNETASEIIMVNITEAGNHAPAVSVTEPSGLPASGNITVTWNASDADNDVLAFSAYLVSRIYDNGTLIGENRTKICYTLQSSCIFDSSLFANGNYAVAVAANDSANYTEAYSNDFEVSNSQVSQAQIQAQQEQAQSAPTQNNEQASQNTGSSGGNGPPPFWWITGPEPEHIAETEEQKNEVSSQSPLIKESIQFEFTPIQKPSQPEAKKDSQVPEPMSMYMFTGVVALILAASAVYVAAYRMVSKSKMKGFQAFIKGKL
ncbi:Ig-like domain-containing protein [Candidatus Woesearchaeota archaeon]|nr:Ig-like domain-containing protein [Candidatus Woesearchaeota archaeon]